MDPHISSARRVLVKQVNWLGDLVMSLPALRAVRQALPQAHLAVLVRRELASFFGGAAWVDEVIPYHVRRGAVGIRDRWQIIAALRRQRFELAVILPRSLDAASWPFLARIPVRAGVVSDTRGWLLTHKAVVATHDPQQHQVHTYLMMLERTLAISGDAGATDIDVSTTERTLMQRWLATQRRRAGRLVALAPAAAYGPAKEWPMAHYASLIDALAERYGVECVLVGAPSERAKCTAVAAATHAGAIVAAGETTIGGAVALLSLCDGFAGNDSGSMHVAGALGIPTVGLFGSTNPARTGPLGRRTHVIYRPLECSPCLQRTCRFGHYNCLSQITPGEIVQALADLGALP